MTCRAVTRYYPPRNKVMRMQAQTAAIENGFVHLPMPHSGSPNTFHEPTVFPNGEQ
jgi:hypothetical protein